MNSQNTEHTEPLPKRYDGETFTEYLVRLADFLLQREPESEWLRRTR